MVTAKQNNLLREPVGAARSFKLVEDRLAPLDAAAAGLDNSLAREGKKLQGMMGVRFSDS